MKGRSIFSIFLFGFFVSIFNAFATYPPYKNMYYAQAANPNVSVVNPKPSNSGCGASDHVISQLQRNNMRQANRGSDALQVAAVWQDKTAANRQLKQYEHYKPLQWQAMFEEELGLAEARRREAESRCGPVLYEEGYEDKVKNALFDSYFDSYHLHSSSYFVDALKKIDKQRYFTKIQKLNCKMQDRSYRKQFKNMPGRKGMEKFETYVSTEASNAKSFFDSVRTQLKEEQAQQRAKQAEFERERVRQETRSKEHTTLARESKTLEDQWKKEAQQKEGEPQFTSDREPESSIFESESREYRVSSSTETLIAQTEGVLKEDFTLLNGTEQQHAMHGRFVTAVDQITNTFDDIAFRQNGFQSRQEFTDFSQCALNVAKRGMELNVQGDMAQASNFASLCEHMAAFARGVQKSAGGSLAFATNMIIHPLDTTGETLVAAKNIVVSVGSIVAEFVNPMADRVKNVEKGLNWIDQAEEFYENTTSLEKTEILGMVTTDVVTGWMTGKVLGSGAMTHMLGAEPAVVISELQNMKSVTLNRFSRQVYPIAIKAVEEGATGVRNGLKFARAYPEFLAAEATVMGAVEKGAVYAQKMETVMEEVGNSYLFQKGHSLVRESVEKAGLPELYAVPEVAGKTLPSATVGSTTFYLDKFGNKWSRAEGASAWKIELSSTIQESLAPVLEKGQSVITSTELATRLGDPAWEAWADSLQGSYVDYMQSQGWSTQRQVSLNQVGVDTLGHLCDPGTNVVQMAAIEKYHMQLDKLRCNDPRHLPNWTARLPKIEENVVDLNAAFKLAHERGDIPTLLEVGAHDFYHIEHGGVGWQSVNGAHTTLAAEGHCGMRIHETVQLENGVTQVTYYHVGSPDKLATKSVFPTGWDGHKVFQQTADAIRRGGDISIENGSYFVTLENGIVVKLKPSFQGVSIFPYVPK